VQCRHNSRCTTPYGFILTDFPSILTVLPIARRFWICSVLQDGHAVFHVQSRGALHSLRHLFLLPVSGGIFLLPSFQLLCRSNGNHAMWRGWNFILLQIRRCSCLVLRSILEHWWINTIVRVLFTPLTATFTLSFVGCCYSRLRGAVHIHSVDRTTTVRSYNLSSNLSSNSNFPDSIQLLTLNCCR